MRWEEGLSFRAFGFLGETEWIKELNRKILTVRKQVERKGGLERDRNLELNWVPKGKGACKLVWGPSRVGP